MKLRNLALGAVALLTLGVGVAAAPVLLKGQDAPGLADADSYISHVTEVHFDAPLNEVLQHFRETEFTDFLRPTDRIPAIADVTLLEGDWTRAGDLRTVTFETGGTASERIIEASDAVFSYQVWNIETPAGRFINHIYGAFEFIEEDDGTRVVWAYNVAPQVFYAAPSIRDFVSNDFAPFMEGGIERWAAAFQGGS